MFCLLLYYGYQSLEETDQYACENYYHKLFYTACQGDNRKRDRYSNIQANENTRVKLGGNGESDYINANYIDDSLFDEITDKGKKEKEEEKEGERRKMMYIASQSPIKETVGHFWQMVYEQRVKVVLMLTKEKEKYSRANERYWPMEKEGFVKEGIRVKAVGEVQKWDDQVLARRFKVEKEDGKEEGKEEEGGLDVLHLQFCAWPDHGVPTSTEMILRLRQTVKGILTKGAGQEEGTSLPPIIVHCSAGIGRTGTYIGIDMALSRIEHALRENRSLDHPDLELDLIYRIVAFLKAQRSGMVQNLDQYTFVYTAVLDGAKQFVASSLQSDHA